MGLWVGGGILLCLLRAEWMNKRPKGYWTDFSPLPLHPLICAFDSDRANYKGILQTGQMGEGKVQNL